ncbi:glutamine-synthetase adenylyltransferase [Falsirhodobacter sp. 20TX0035]|uniref:[protein-PII] uridylyltransferase family protein n=1 Tax=Falsirhodobacter sp. 20TX0035 TaxID=3022019 RepID=UPI00232D10D9|nr:glutamine-synthetase adenylyltransferase [Falsirhodobacter sp. 20TX0035]MDB6453323.1 glutamine-synthetase adenylyltransferase [Falsirhodobacter sp. 20TX0035]
MDIKRLPLEHDPAVAAEIRDRFTDQAERELLARAASASPYLKDLLRREGDWLRGALPDADAALAAELARDADLTALPATLREMKRRVALLTALADLGGTWDLERVTGALSDLADRAVDLCVRRLVEAEVRRGKLPSADAGGGMVVLAMGKTGARELNYSSDIDLICLFDETRHDDWQEARSAFIRVTRRMTAILSDVTDGYVFRTDLRLRPDAAVTPVCLSMGAAESYYESEGRTWERAAFIKARPCGGDLEAGERFLTTLRPFVWRKHLDFATIEDTHDMRTRIRDHRGLHGPLKVEGHDLKLGQGGIRDIEFFTQTRQLIAGGRDPSLRSRTTVGGLAALAEAGWIGSPTAVELTDLYRAHREMEHRLQMVADQQTHRIPAEPDAFARVARLAGQEPDAFRDTMLDRLTRTAERTEAFFTPTDAPEEPDLDPRTREIVARWQGYPALRSSRARTIFRRLRPQLLAELQKARDPDEALLSLDGFLRGLPAGVQIFSLFEANPQLVDLIVNIASVAPDLARYLSQHSGVLDAVIGGHFFEAWPSVPALQADLARQLDRAADYEGKLDTARRWMKERHFRIGVHHLRGLATAEQVGREYADLARAVIGALWPAVVEEFARRHGPQPGRGAVVLGMGSLGAGRMHARSDIDLIVIYDNGSDAESSGLKPLSAQAYYSRLTQALLTALTARTAEGALYAADMRLRPSGRQGPLATSIGAFRTYQMDAAWTWEHLALTRADPLAGPPDLMADVEALRREVLRVRGRDPRVAADVADMRRRLATAKPLRSPWDARNGTGRLMDLELMGEFLTLTRGGAERSLRAQLEAGGPELEAADSLFWRLQAASRLLSPDPLHPDVLGEGGRTFLQREMGDVDALTEEIEHRAAEVGAAFDRWLNAGPPLRAPAP